MDQRHEFLSRFNWKDSLLDADEKARVKLLLINYFFIFARPSLQTQASDEIQIKELTIKHNKSVLSQSLLPPATLKDDLLVEFALMRVYGTKAPLFSSKFSSPIFAQRKPNGKPRRVVDLRRTNYLINRDYGEHNDPVTTIWDARRHMAATKQSCKRDPSHANHCIQVANEQSTQLFSFIFGSLTFAFERSAQVFSRSLSAFTDVKKEYLDPAVKENQ